MRNTPILSDDQELQACDRRQDFVNMISRAAWSYRLLRVTMRDSRTMLCMGYNLGQELQVRYGPTGLKGIVIAIDDVHYGYDA